MPTALDVAFIAQRERLATITQQNVVRLWTLNHNDRERALDVVVPTVEAGQRRSVHLVNAYMVASARAAGHDAKTMALDPNAYTTTTLRGVDAREVYARPWGALGGQLAEGSEYVAALQSAQFMAGKLARTDLQMAHRSAARDWMAQDQRVIGWRRVLGGSKHCALCQQASTRTYRKADLMPIHEGCHCSVAPVYGREPVASVGTTVRVEHDPELGPRLVADTWQQTGPRLL
jgi:hypothetical protein